MNDVDKYNLEIAELTKKRDEAILKDKANVLAKMKDDIKLYGFKTTDFKGVLATRKKKVGAAAKKTTAKKKA